MYETIPETVKAERQQGVPGTITYMNGIVVHVALGDMVVTFEDGEKRVYSPEVFLKKFRLK